MTAPIRTTQVRPPSKSGEARIVTRAMALVAALALLVIASRSIGSLGGAPREGDLLPFQRLFRELEPELQRSYRALQEGLIEAENARSATRAWPAPEALAAQGIPPFAADPTEKVRYSWSLAQDGLCVNYRGAPLTPGAPELLAWIQEPVPGYSEKLAPGTPTDEVHHVLADGTVLHVSLWFRPSGAASERIVCEPVNVGFLQMLAGSSPGK